MKIIISKLDAAKRQLETTISLFFQEADPVSVHSLARASHEILEAVCKKQGHNSILEEGFEKWIKKDKVKEVKDKLNETKNFFKHGASDGDKSIEFNPDLSGYYIWDACRLYRLLTSEFTKGMYIFNTWFTMIHPDTLLSPEQQQSIKSINIKETFNPDNKRQFYLELSSAYDLLKINGRL
jgi:hypothetical protein